MLSLGESHFSGAKTGRQTEGTRDLIREKRRMRFGEGSRGEGSFLFVLLCF